MPHENPWRTLTTLTAALEDFLKTYKSSSTAAEDGLEELNLDGDDDSEDYDFMDDVENGNGRTRGRNQCSKVKYMKLLQQVADRKTAQITIELDDLEEVWHSIEYMV